jgi:hypothetical protein
MDGNPDHKLTDHQKACDVAVLHAVQVFNDAWQLKRTCKGSVAELTPLARTEVWGRHMDEATDAAESLNAEIRVIEDEKKLSVENLSTVARLNTVLHAFTKAGLITLKQGQIVTHTSLEKTILRCALLSTSSKQPPNCMRIWRMVARAYSQKTRMTFCSN